MKDQALKSPVCLQEIQEKYSPLLEETNSLIRQHLLSLAPQSERLRKTLEASRGKQLRPLLTYAVMAGFGGDLHKTPRLAAVFESIHIASLLHDDVIDKCRLRRNMPTMNEIYGDGVAILLGDMVFVAIYRLAASLDQLWIIKVVNDTIHRLIEGELLQQQHKFNAEEKHDDYEAIISRKTAALLELCCYASAKIAERPEEEAVALKNYARHFGIIFQIVDDWADFSKSRETDHKDRGVDIANGFLTLPWLLLLEKCTEEEKNGINAVISEKKPAGLNEEIVKSLALKYDLPELMSQTIQSHLKSCKSALAGIKDFDDTELQVFLEFVVQEFYKISDKK